MLCRLRRFGKSEIAGDSVPNVETTLTEKIKSELSFVHWKTKKYWISVSLIIIATAVLGSYYFLKYRPENNIVLLRESIN